MNHPIQTHPGEVLREEFLTPMAMSARKLANSIGVPANRITGILNEERSVSADTAIRLGLFFKTTPEFWLNLQQAHDLSLAWAARDEDDALLRREADLEASGSTSASNG